MLRRVQWRLLSAVMTLVMVLAIPTAANSAPSPNGQGGSTGATKQIKLPAPLKQLSTLGPLNKNDLFRPLLGTKLDPNARQSILDPDSPTGRLLQSKSQQLPERRGPDSALHGKQGGPAQLEAIRRNLAAKALASDQQKSQPAATPGTVKLGTAAEGQVPQGKGMPGASQISTKPGTLVVEQPPAAPVYKRAGKNSGTVNPLQESETTPVVTLTPELLAPDKDVTVNVTVVEEGVPTPGATVTVSGAVATTDEDGNAVLKFHTGPDREILDVMVETALFSGVAGELYVVPDGYGVITVAGITDKNSAPIDDFAMLITHVDSGWWWASITWGSHSQSNIVPVGPAYVETTANVDTLSYYLYRTVDVKDFERVVLNLTSDGTIHVTTTAQVDGTAVTGSLALHNEEMVGAPSWVEYLYKLGPDAYVTKGTYTYSFLGDNLPQPLLVTASEVALETDTAIAIEQEKGQLGTVALPATDGWGNPLTLSTTLLFYNPFLRAIPGKATGLLVSSDFAYTTWNYTADLTQGSDQYHIFFDSYASSVSPGPGKTATIALGGKITAELTPINTCSDCVISAYVGLTTAVPDMVSVYKNGEEINGVLTMKDSKGNPIVTYNIPSSWWMADIYIPPVAPDVYTLSLTYDLGPYQTPATAEAKLNLNPIQVSVSPRVIAPETPTEVQVTVTDAAGNPLPDTRVLIGWSGEVGEAYTDEKGIAWMTVWAPYIDIYPVQAMGNNGWNVLAIAHLFALTPDLAGLELNALDVDGKPLKYFWVHTSYLPGGWEWSNWAEIGPVPTIVPGEMYGNNYIELIREGNPAYFLSQTGRFKGGQVTDLTWSAADMSPTYFSVFLDDQPVQGAVALHGKLNHNLTFFDGVYLDEYGQGVAYVAEGQYDVKIRQTYPENILAIRRSMSFNKGEAIFHLKSADLGTLETKVVAKGTEAPHDFLLNSREFETYVKGGGTIRVTPDTYAIPWIEYTAEQPDSGETWAYAMARDPQMTVTVKPEKTATYTWDATVKQGKMAVYPNEYQAWDFIWFQMQPVTADGWYYEGAWLAGNEWDYRGLPWVTITDASGEVVEDYKGNPIDNYFFIATDTPGDFYTINMSADLGVAGKIKASTKIYKQAPSTLTVNTEILPVGKSTALVATLTRNGQPVKNEWVSLLDGWGNSVRDARTNAKGQATFQVKPAYMDYYILMANGYNGMKILYALEPGWGLLDVRANDKDGKPLEAYEYVTTDGYYGYNADGIDLKAIAPAGQTKAIVYGVTEEAQYYLTTEALVPDRSAVTVNVGGANTAPLQVTVTNGSQVRSGWLYLRNKAIDYVETVYMPYNLSWMNQIYATPGDYEAMVRAGKGWDLYLLDAGDFNLPTVNSITVDLSAATAELEIDGRDGNDNTTETDVMLRSGQIGTPIYYYYYDHIYATPGAYGVDIADMYLYDYDAEEYWIYEFIGMSKAEAKAGEVAALKVGGPLTYGIKTDQQTYGAGDKVKVTGAATANNMTLAIAISISDWIYLWPNFGIVTNSSGQIQYMTYYFTDTWTWPSPNKAGTYNLYFLRGNGPYGPEEVECSTWVNLTTKNR
ncbi:MAG: hypothetical protein ACM3XM_12665 [Mycobacterium leprae]